MSLFAETVQEKMGERSAACAQELLGSIIQEKQYVGEVYSLGYETALVQIHDHHRRKVGGIPSLSFLIATRLAPGASIEFPEEHSSLVLLRVMDAAPLPNDAEASRIRVQSAQRVSGELDQHWDTGAMDTYTANELSFAGVKCRVLGTFYLDENTRGDEPPLVLRFGSDISNYYPNKGLKVFKPNEAALRAIVNYRDADRIFGNNTPVAVGKVRYASTNRAFQGVTNVDVEIMPEDLLGQKTALFGMTRTGKSNTTKIVLQSVFNLRFSREKPQRIGQIVFDPNGEYANENTQDGDKDNPNAIKNVWKHRGGTSQDVVTYGITRHPDDPARVLMLLNFYEDSNLQVGKEIIDASIETETSIFLSNFRQVNFTSPPNADFSAITRCRRRIAVYRALLFKAGFEVPTTLQPDLRRLFSADVITSMSRGTDDEPGKYQAASNILSTPTPTWGQLVTAFEALADYVNNRRSDYSAFNQAYTTRRNSSGEPWADEDLKKLLEMFRFANGPRLIGRVREQHTASTTADYVEEIYDHLQQGRLVIVDQSGGDESLNKGSADRIMLHIFKRNQAMFRSGVKPYEVLVYLEEAHNLLPSAEDKNTQTVWVRTAKEGAKYHIGLVYATQEVSSIQRNILKNTSNWFIGHLNNTDETRELCKYYDFADFEGSIRRAQDKGFIRVKTLSNLFVVPVQVRLFEVNSNAI